MVVVLQLPLVYQKLMYTASPSPALGVSAPGNGFAPVRSGANSAVDAVDDELLRITASARAPAEADPFPLPTSHVSQPYPFMPDSMPFTDTLTAEEFPHEGPVPGEPEAEEQEEEEEDFAQPMPFYTADGASAYPLGGGWPFGPTTGGTMYAALADPTTAAAAGYGYGNGNSGSPGVEGAEGTAGDEGMVPYSSLQPYGAEAEFSEGFDPTHGSGYRAHTAAPDFYGVDEGGFSNGMATAFAGEPTASAAGWTSQPA
jgi:hypothetical protein